MPLLANNLMRLTCSGCDWPQSRESAKIFVPPPHRNHTLPHPELENMGFLQGWLTGGVVGVSWPIKSGESSRTEADVHAFFNWSTHPYHPGQTPLHPPAKNPRLFRGNIWWRRIFWFRPKSWFTEPHINLTGSVNR